MATPPPPFGFSFEMFAVDRNGDGKTSGELASVGDIHAWGSGDSGYNPDWNSGSYRTVVTGTWNETRAAQWAFFDDSYRAYKVTDVLTFRPEKILVAETEVIGPLRSGTSFLR